MSGEKRPQFARMRKNFILDLLTSRGCNLRVRPSATSLNLAEN